MMIRNYIPEDAAVIEELDPFGMIELSYNNDVFKDQVFTAVRDGRAVGVMFFLCHFSWYGEKEPHNRVIPCIYTDDSEVRRELLQYATEWIKSDCHHFAGKRPALANWTDSGNLEEIREFMNAGFNEYNVSPRLRYDLEELREYPKPEGLTVELLDMSDAAVREYMECTARGNDGNPDSENELRFISNEPSFKCFVARIDGSFAAAVSIWRITDEVSAVENIFCLPEFRKRGITKWLITYAMTQAKEAGYLFCELGMFGRNRRAQSLYLGMGFKLNRNNIELLYPTNTPDTLYLP